MEYVEFYGTHADIPVDEIVVAWKRSYGDERVLRWIAEFDEKDGVSGRDFDKEEVIQHSVTCSSSIEMAGLPGG